MKMSKLAQSVVLSFIFMACIVNCQEPDVISLGRLNINEAKITLSGFSGGSTMATQFHMAHSSLFSGVALFSQAWYRCGPSNIIEFGLGCTTFGNLLPTPRYNISRSVEDARNYATGGFIDPLEGLANQKIFVWTGSRDNLIPMDVAVQNIEFYKHFITNNSQLILTVHSAEHVFPSDNYGPDCEASKPAGRAVANCNFSGPYESLKFLVGDEITKPIVEETIIQPLQYFNQSEFYFGTDIKHISMAKAGLVYIPEYCKDIKNQCLLHFHFHGCGESEPVNSGNHVRNAGYLHVAELNNIVMVFPLTLSTINSLGGCWDFYSYNGQDFATKQGRQIQVMHNMIQRIVEKDQQPPSTNPTSTNEPSLAHGHSPIGAISSWFIALAVLNFQQFKLLN